MNLSPKLLRQEKKITMSPILMIHIFSGAIALLFGASALTFRKGSCWHRKAGNIFFISVLVASICAMYMSVMFKHEFPFYPIIIFYLVATSWVTIKRPQGKIGRFEIGAFLIITIITISLFTLALDPANGPQGTNESGLYFFFGVVAALAATLDLNMIIRGGLTGGHRIARHLWRMCLALTAGMASFLDQKQFIPKFLLDTELLWIPLPLMLVLMTYWLSRLLFTKFYNKLTIISSNRNSVSGT
jgi:uncharacterized membrane protein